MTLLILGVITGVALASFVAGFLTGIFLCGDDYEDRTRRG
jgi:hypothetical protein